MRWANRKLWLISTTLICCPVSAQVERQRWDLHLDVYSVSSSTSQASWLAGGAGKLRYDAAHDGPGLARAFVQYTADLTPAWTARLVADYVDDGDTGIDVTETYLAWHPVPASKNRYRLRVGFFYPELSLENDGPGWSNSYTISSSAINTWIAEEVKTLGAEWSWSRPLGPRAAGRQIELVAASFLGNDPAGTLLAWKGWSLHDRQTRLHDVLPLPSLPQIAPGMMFDRQARQSEPFIETDDKPGFYVGGRWQLGRRALLSAAHYDNHADPESLRDGQYGWTTRFDHVGLKLELPGSFGLIAERISGTTAMGPIIGPAHVVDAAFDSHYLLLTRPLGKHRVSLRFDAFEVTDRDIAPLDDNAESGTAWTLDYRYRHSDRLFAELEWLAIQTQRPAWAYAGLAVAQTERALRLRLSYRFGSETG